MVLGSRAGYAFMLGSAVQEVLAQVKELRADWAIDTRERPKHHRSDKSMRSIKPRRDYATAGIFLAGLVSSGFCAYMIFDAGNTTSPAVSAVLAGILGYFAAWTCNVVSSLMWGKLDVGWVKKIEISRDGNRLFLKMVTNRSVIMGYKNVDATAVIDIQGDGVFRKIEMVFHPLMVGVGKDPVIVIDLPDGCQPSSTLQVVVNADSSWNGRRYFAEYDWILADIPKT
jgi:hypothetical protein